MLMNVIKKSYRDLIRHTDPVQPIVTVPSVQPAANASGYSQSEMQARRQRRERRMDRVGQHSSSGWKVRAW
jgi:hypothetical protein